MPFRCGGLTKNKTKCRICVKEQGGNCRWHHSERLVTCTICLCEVAGGAGGQLKQCGHVFHGDCILPWFVRCGERADGSLTCPNCRGVVTDPPTVIWVGEHSSVSEPDEGWRRGRVWRRLARAAAEQRIASRRGLLEHVRGLFDRIAGQVTDDERSDE